MTKKTAPKKRRKEFQTRKAILDILKQQGPQDSQTIAGQLGVTAMAVRQHLYALQDEKLLTYTEAPRPKGRPAKMWGLTAGANKFFPDGNSELLADMLGLIDNVLGQEALGKVIDMRAQNQYSLYQQRVSEAETLAEKLEILAEIRTAEGYMAEVQSQDDGSYLLIENHCPICTAAQACQKFCSAEQNLFRNLLAGASVQRQEYILGGARRCTYEIRPND